MKFSPNNLQSLGLWMEAERMLHQIEAAHEKGQKTPNFVTVESPT
jgi:hypothetical protein